MLQSVWRPAFRPVMSSPFETAVGGDPLLRAVRKLFANGEEGALYYFTPDFAGLYQDAAGTTPVTAVGQPVGLMLDRRFGLGVGEDVTTGGHAVSFAPSYNLETILPDGRVMITKGDHVSAHRGYWHTSVEEGKWYEVAIDVENLTEKYLTARTFTSDGSAAGQVVFGSCPPFTRETFKATIRVNGDNVAFGAELTDAEEGDSFIVGDCSVREFLGNRASQTTTTARPTLRSGPLRIDYDGVDDYLRTVFPDLGSNVTIARSIPGTGAQILTGQTIAAGNWDDNVDSCATLVIDRALTGPETALVTAFLNQQAGV